jgi:hypothetical protein
MTMQEYTPWASNIPTNQAQIKLNDFVTDYMNLEETRTAFNIPTDAPAW